MYQFKTISRGLLMALMLSSATGTVCAQDRLYADEFPLGDVTLLDGPLKKARDLNINTLLKYDCDRLLAPYLKEAGLTPKGKSYPNWDGLDGHVGGHYLTALAINAATGDEECRKHYVTIRAGGCQEKDIEKRKKKPFPYIHITFPNLLNSGSDSCMIY